MSTYKPEEYIIFKVLEQDHPGYKRKRYTFKKLDSTLRYTESKKMK